MALRDVGCPWQALMDGPYRKWQEHDRSGAMGFWSFGDMLQFACSTEKERAACVLGKLNQQVENGGFVQWADNNYATHSIALLRQILPQMGPASQQVLALCEQIMQCMDEDGEFVVEDDWGATMEVSDRLSDEFYSLEDAWHEEVYAFLEGDRS